MPLQTSKEFTMNKKIITFIIASLLTLLAISYPRLANAQVSNPSDPQSGPVDSVCAITDGSNILDNPNFQEVNGSPTNPLSTSVSGGGQSYAKFWTLWHNGAGTTNTELLPIPLSNNQKMIHVTTTASNSGLVQAYGPRISTPPQRAIASAWVFVKSGRVGIGVGNGGSTSIAANNYSSTLYKWERIQSQNNTSPATQIIIYSGSNNNTVTTEFYVANACVTGAS